MNPSSRPLSGKILPLSGKITPDLSRFPGTDSRPPSAFRDFPSAPFPLSENFFPPSDRFPPLASRGLPAFREFSRAFCPLSGSFGKSQKANCLDLPTALEHDNTMKEHPILFSGPLVRAILAGQKTQTRRLLRVQPELPMLWYPTPVSKRSLAYDGEAHFRKGAPTDFAPWKPGDRLWVRETWMPGYDHRSVNQGDDESVCEVIYRGASNAANVSEFRPAPDDVAEEWMRLYSEDGDDDPRWRPSIRMPRWASRLALEVEEVRVQRLGEISESDAQAEGIHEHPLGRAALDANGTHKGAFLAVWEAINGARPGGSIADNPWVWAMTFKRVQA